MAIKSIYNSEEDIPELLKEHATKMDDKFVVDVEDIEDHPKVINLRNAYTQEKEKRKADRKILNVQKTKIELLPDDFTAEKWEELKKMELEAVDPEEQKQKIRDELEAQRQKVRSTLEQEHKAEKEKMQEKIDSQTAFIEKIVRQDRLREGLVEAGVDKALLPGAMALLHSRVVIEEKDGDFVDVVETDMGPMSAKDYALKWVDQDEGKPYVKAASGPDLSPGKKYITVEGNPWMPGPDHNLTKQQEIFKTDKDKARRLMAEAKKAVKA